MSKLALIRAYQYSPQAGGFFSFLGPVAKGVAGFVKSALNVGKKAAPAIAAAAKSPVGQAALYAGAGAASAALLRGSGGGGGGATGYYGRRRARGITATELRGYRKVANLIHREGMVSRRARGRKSS